MTPERKVFPLKKYADGGELCPDARLQPLFVDLWNEWRAIDPITSMPVILVLDFTGVKRVLASAAEECLSPFIRIVLGNNRPCYVTCEHLPDMNAYRALQGGFSEGGIVVITQLDDAEFDLTGDADKVRRYRSPWRRFMNAERGWTRGQTLIQEHKFPRSLHNEMYEDGILIKDVDGNSYFHQVFGPVTPES